MHATGGNKLIRRPDSYAFSKKHNKRPFSADSSQKNKDVNEVEDSKKKLSVSPLYKYGLVGLYKQCCNSLNEKIHPSVIFPLKYNQELALDMDCL